MSRKNGLRFLAMVAWFSTFIPPWFHGPILGTLFWYVAVREERKEKRKERERQETLEQIADNTNDT